MGGVDVASAVLVHFSAATCAMWRCCMGSEEWDGGISG